MSDPKLLERLAELQRLCDRAYQYIAERWDKEADGSEYGPNSLLRYLDQARKGQEYRDITQVSDQFIKINNQLEIEVQRLRDELKELTAWAEAAIEVHPDLVELVVYND